MSEVWPKRLRRDREARGLSQRDAALEFIAHSPHHAEWDAESIERTWKRWERGDVRTPSPDNQAAIAAMFGVPRESYFPRNRPQLASPTLTDDETLELVQRLRSSSIDGTVLDLAGITVDRLCTDYASTPGHLQPGATS